MNECPKCGHVWPDEKRASGGFARWKNINKKQRSKTMQKIAKMRWKRDSHNLK